MATTHTSNGLGPPEPTKKLAHWVELLGQLLSWNHFFENFRGEPSLNDDYFIYSFRSYFLKAIEQIF